MASQGPNSSGTIISDSAVGTRTWSNPSYAGSSDDQRASAVGNVGTRYTYYLKATNFGFSIPDGATINGIVVAIERSRSTNDLSIYDDKIYLVKSGSVSGNNKANTGTNWPIYTSESSATYGSSSDLWGNTLTVSDVNASDFGVALSAKITVAPKGSGSAYVDHITITVTYTEGGGGASTVPVIMNQYRQRSL